MGPYADSGLDLVQVFPDILFCSASLSLYLYVFLGSEHTCRLNQNIQLSIMVHLGGTQGESNNTGTCSVSLGIF